MKYLIFILTFISLRSLACSSVEAPLSLNMAISLEQKDALYYTDKRYLHEKPSVSLDNCLETSRADKYLMFAIGLENFILSDDTLTYSINDRISGAGESCRIENNYFSKVQNSEQRRQRLLEKRRFINSCLVFNVTDFSKAGIIAKEEQPGCKVTRLSDYSIDFEGPFCFIKPSADSLISFNVNIKKECLDKDIYKKRELILQDVLGLLSLYIAGDDSGFSSDLTNLKQTKLRVSVNPIDKLMLNNAYVGEKKPVWPTVWTMPEVYFAKPEIDLSSNEYDLIRFPLLVNNICERACADGLCSGPCDYSQPIVAEYNLYEVRGEKEELLKTWYDGGITPAQWQGIIHGVGTRISKNLLTENQLYKLQINLDDIELNYLSFKGQIERMLRMNNTIGPMNRSGSAIRTIPTINNVGTINDLPTIRPINGIYFDGNGFTAIKEALRSLELVYRNSFWPPFFDETCINGRCMGQKNLRNKANLYFRLKKEENEYSLLNVSFNHESNLFVGKNISNYNFSKSSCAIDDVILGPDVDDFDF